MVSKVGSFKKEWEAEICPKVPGVVARTTAYGYMYFLPCQIFNLVSSLSTSVLKWELYWDMRWALGWVSSDIAVRLGCGCVIETEILLTNPLLVFLLGLFDLEWRLVPLKR